MTGQHVLDGLSCRDKLLFSQAVYELGADAWPAVSKLLLQHPLIELPRPMLAPQSCSKIYLELVAELPPTVEGRDDDAAAKKPHARLHLRLAQKHYKARVEELRETISAEEAEFATVANEVEQLRSGAWDEKLAAEMRAKTAGKPTETVAVAEQDKPATDDKDSAEKESMDVESAPQDADDEIVDTTLQLDNHESDVAESAKPSRATTPPADGTVSEGKEEVAHRIPLDQAKDKVDPVVDAPAEDASKPADDAKEDGAPPVSVHATPPLFTTALPDEPKESPKPVVPSSPASAKPTPKDAEEPEAPARPSKKAAKATRSSRRTRNNRSPSPAEDMERETSAEPPSATTEKHPDDPDDAGVAPEADAMQIDEEPASVVMERVAETPQKPKTESRLASTTSPQTTNVTPDAAEKVPQTASRPNTRKGKRKADSEKELSVRPVKRLREASENMDTADEYEVSTPVRRMADSDAQKQFQKFITVLHSEISGHRTGNIFHRPVTKAEAPDYYDIVKRPMDLGTIKRRFTKSNEISNPIEYQRDLNLMFCNSLMYNRPNSDLHEMARNMMVDCEKAVQEFFQAHDVLQERPR
ncbi:hypothetical protein AURDEDRAFT_110416 [Auricularia subglabra TFB-10046 SS5]|nr:hypothetical protein AURDEDRAFT_110416 [Auricularia subglabra TFB-10046 SS5]